MTKYDPETIGTLDLAGLHDTYSEMLATAHDINFDVPNGLLVETDDIEVLRATCTSLHEAITEFRAKKDAGGEGSGQQEASRKTRSAAKATKSAKPAKKPAAKKTAPKSTEGAQADDKEKTEMTNTAKKATKKAAPKKAAKAAKSSKKAAASNARTGVGASRYTPEQVITVKAKAENPARDGSEKFNRIAAVLKSKTVGAALKAGARTGTINFCVDNGLITVK